MTIRNLFIQEGLDETLARIEKLTPETEPQWGKMNIGQMFAHCNVAYDMALTDKYPIAGKFKTFMISLFAKKAVVGPKPYPKNSRTAPAFIISGERNYKKEKTALIENLKKTKELGPAHFNGKTSVSFGPLSTEEWNVLFSKHLDHHLTQFGV